MTQRSEQDLLFSLGFQALKEYLIHETGLAYYQDKDADLQYKIQSRMQELNLSRFEAYLDYLRQPLQGTQEMDQLVQQLTIGETYFFRHSEQLSAIKDSLLPELLAAKRSTKKLNIWSAGCATGEETYSLAIILHANFPELKDWQVEILGTDINPAFLERARAACYRKWSFRNTEERLRLNYFEDQGNVWQLRQAYRRWVRFQQHNLKQDDFSRLGVGRFDLVICRNVLIYFSRSSQEALVQGFYDGLHDPGWLVLGPAELTSLACAPFVANDLSRLSCFKKTGEPIVNRSNFSVPEFLRPQPSIPQPFAPFVWQPSILSERETPVLSPDQIMSRPFEPPTEALPAVSLSLEGIKVLADQGELQEAERLCREMVQNDPLNARAYYYLGLILSAADHFKTAQEALLQALYLDRQNLLAHYHLGVLYQQQGALQRAKKALANAARLLEKYSETDVLPDAEGMTIRDLNSLIQLQQKGLK